MSCNEPVLEPSNFDLQWSQDLSSALDNDDHRLFAEDTNSYGQGRTSIDLSTLQRLNIYNLQRRLVLCVKEIIEAQESTSKIPLDVMDRLPELLTLYFAALRDAKWVRKCLQDPEFRYPMCDNLSLFFDSPGVASIFTSTGLFPRHGQRVPPSSPSLPRVPKNWDIGSVFFEEHQRKQEVKNLAQKAFLSRLYMAAFGGTALIGPMLIMTLLPSKITALVTTSLSVTLVAVLLAYFMKDATPKDIIGATAAYAAVLVVFVGTSF